MNIYKTIKSIQVTSSRVLSVDDEESISEMVAAWLAREGLACDTAASAEQAVSLLSQRHYDLVVSDIMMPGKSGIDLLNIISEEFPETAVLMATGLDSRDTAVQALEKGAFGYMIKPFERMQFVVNVYNALERRRIVLEHDNYERRLEEEVQERTADIRKREEEIALKLISASGYRDEETGEHIRRIGLYGRVLAGRLGWNQEELSYMAVAGPMHDVGKIGIADEILNKPGKLTPEEFVKIKEHTVIGRKILEDTETSLISMAGDIAEFHHEKWDGSGYPHGLKGEDIPESARIVAVADVYDALSNNRVYRAALPEEQVLAIMREGRGSHFNPDVFDAFLEVLPEFRQILHDHRDRR